MARLVDTNFEIIHVEGMGKCLRDEIEYYTMQQGQEGFIVYETYRGENDDSNPHFKIPDKGPDNKRSTLC